eukprot:scaffold1526_cov35-Tisochrysis_lutea.AAC.2
MAFCNIDCLTDIVTPSRVHLFSTLRRGDVVRSTPLITPDDRLLAQRIGNFTITNYVYTYQLQITSTIILKKREGETLQETAEAIRTLFTGMVTDVARLLDSSNFIISTRTFFPPSPPPNVPPTPPPPVTPPKSPPRTINSNLKLIAIGSAGAIGGIATVVTFVYVRRYCMRTRSASQRYQVQTYRLDP